MKHSPKGKLTLLLVYVDDVIVARDDEHEKQILKEKLVTKFEMKNLRKLKYFLRIKVAYLKKGIFISQRKTTGVPMEQIHIIGSDEGRSIVNIKDLWGSSFT